MPGMARAFPAWSRALVSQAEAAAQHGPGQAASPRFAAGSRSWETRPLPVSRNGAHLMSRSGA